MAKRHREASHNNMIGLLTHLGILEIAGADAEKFLQGQLTCDLTKIAPATGCLGAHCNPQGRILSLFGLYAGQNAYYLVTPLNMLELTQKNLQKYARFFKVTLSLANHIMHALGYIGRSDTPLTLPKPCMRWQVSSDTTRTIIVGPHAIITEYYHAQQQIVPQFSVTDWQLRDIITMTPNLRPETYAKLLPQEINGFELGMISLDKGCYTGQEIIARMHYRSQIKFHLKATTINANQLENAEIKIGNDVYSYDAVTTTTKICGMIIDAIQDHAQKYHFLLVIKPWALKQPIYLDAIAQLALT